MRNTPYLLFATLLACSQVGAKNKITDVEFINLPGACFQMGDVAESFLSDRDEYPLHEVCLHDYSLSKYEVTRGQWPAIMSESPVKSQTSDSLPITNISWYQANEFICQLNRNGPDFYRLPTEAEWEYAARSKGLIHKYASEDGSIPLFWSGFDAEQPIDVKLTLKNAAGFYGMSGNVNEWVSDWGEEEEVRNDKTRNYFSRSPKDNPQGPENGQIKVNRGGNYSDGRRTIRVANRRYLSPFRHSSRVGFRLVKTDVNEHQFPCEYTYAREADDSYQTGSWSMYPNLDQSGFSEPAMQAARQEFDETGSAAVLVIFRGKVLLDWGNTLYKYPLHSIRKSLLSLLYGASIENIDDFLKQNLTSLPIAQQVSLKDKERQATIHDLMISRSGVYLPAAYETAQAKELKPERGSFSPGEHFYYNNWDFNALGKILEDELGLSVFEAFQQKLALPLGIESFELSDGIYRWEDDAPIPAYTFKMNSYDLARLGQLYLDNGRIRNKQLIPEDWLNKSTKAYSEEAQPGLGYGYMWWIRNSPFKIIDALGYGGHRLTIIPDADLVFVHRVNTPARQQISTRQSDILLRRVLSAHPKAYQAETLDKYVKIPKPYHVENKVLSSYVGKYDLGEGRVVSVTLKEGVLFAALNQNPKEAMYPVSETAFYFKTAIREVEFTIDKAGNVTGMNVSDEGSQSVAEKIE